MKTWKKWTKEDIEKLRELSETHNKSEIAEIMGRTKSSIDNQFHSLGIKCKVTEIEGQWSERDTIRLMKLSEKHTASGMARILKRSKSSINNKRRELGIEDSLLERTDKWTFKQITDALGLSNNVVNKTFVKYGLKFQRRGRYCLVNEEDLLQFMKEHPELWDATKCDYYLFYQYPWFKKKLAEDKKIPVQNRKYYWTDYQKNQFTILKRRGYTHKQIAAAIGKTKKAVDHYSANHKV